MRAKIIVDTVNKRKLTFFSNENFIACHGKCVSSSALHYSSDQKLSEPPVVHPWQKISVTWSSWSPGPILWRICRDFCQYLCRGKRESYQKNVSIIHHCFWHRYNCGCAWVCLMCEWLDRVCLFGTLKPIVSYGSAANKTYWYRLSGASTLCSYLLHNQTINRRRGLLAASGKKKDEGTEQNLPSFHLKLTHVRRHESVPWLQPRLNGGVLDLE